MFVPKSALPGNRPDPKPTAPPKKWAGFNIEEQNGKESRVLRIHLAAYDYGRVYLKAAPKGWDMSDARHEAAAIVGWLSHSVPSTTYEQVRAIFRK